VYKRAVAAHAGAAYLHAQLAEAYLGSVILPLLLSSKRC
jgi:hypothetical protein